MDGISDDKMAKLQYPNAKRLLRYLYRTALGVYSFLLLCVPAGNKKTAPRIFFGGARSGDSGGPLVKVKRLKQAFDEYYLRYNLVYILSNASYLPCAAYKAIRKRGIPIVFNQNGVFYPAWYHGDWQRENRHMACPYHLADYVFYQSEFCRKAADKFLGEREGPGEVLYNAVDTEYFSPGNSSSNDRERGFVFLLTGRIQYHLFYRIETTLRGLAMAREKGLNAGLVIGGGLDARTINASHSLIQELRLDGQVTLTGSYTQREAPQIYRGAHAYIMTKHNDPCPNAVIEALSCGLPVIYSNTGGVPELVGNDAGVALDCENDWDRPRVPSTEDIAQAMIRVGENYQSMSQAARNRAVRLFDIRQWLQRHKEIFQILLDSGT